MFPITETLDLLAMIRGQKPFNLRDTLKDAAALLSFAADQLPVSGAVEMAQTAGAMEEPHLESMLAQLVERHDDSGAAMAPFTFDWKALAKEIVSLLLSKCLA